MKIHEYAVYATNDQIALLERLNLMSSQTRDLLDLATLPEPLTVKYTEEPHCHRLYCEIFKHRVLSPGFGNYVFKEHLVTIVFDTSSSVPNLISILVKT